MAGALDGARMAYQINKVVGYGSGQIRAMLIGDHGQNMIPMPEISAVGGVPLNQLISKDEMEAIIARTKDGGAEIVKHLGTSAYYAPGRAISVMVEAILDDIKSSEQIEDILDQYKALGINLVDKEKQKSGKNPGYRQKNKRKKC